MQQIQKNRKAMIYLHQSWKKPPFIFSTNHHEINLTIKGIENRKIGNETNQTKRTARSYHGYWLRKLPPPWKNPLISNQYKIQWKEIKKTKLLQRKTNTQFTESPIKSKKLIFKQKIEIMNITNNANANPSLTHQQYSTIKIRTSLKLVL